MDLRQLEYFVAVAEEANFTRAADRVHITQSGVSAQIKQFERELGAELFDRTARTVRLTAAGAAALPHARSALAAAAAIRTACDDVNGLLRGRLRLAMVTGCTITPLFEALAEFHRRHPQIEIALTEDNSETMLDQVRAGAVDTALAAVAGGVPDGLSSLTIVREGLVAAVPRDHPLAGARSVSLEALTAYPLICLPLGTGVRAVLDRACAAAGLRPEVSLQATAPGAVLDLAARGLGVAVLSASMVHAGMCSVPISDVAMPAILALVWREESSVLRELLPLCRQYFGV